MVIFLATAGLPASSLSCHLGLPIQEDGVAVVADTEGLGRGGQGHLVVAAAVAKDAAAVAAVVLPPGQAKLLATDAAGGGGGILLPGAGKGSFLLQSENMSNV